MTEFIFKGQTVVFP